MALTGDLLELYETTAIREGVLCWYPFVRNSKTLDCSQGILTDLLKRKTSEVHSASSTQLEGLTAYDYIVVLDPNNITTKALCEYRELLNSHGRLLLAYENPFALRYWAGHSAPNTGKPYDTLFGNGDDPLPSKVQLTLKLTQAGFSGLKWYYPLTDHWITTEVYSDSYLPNEFLNQRFESYLDNDSNRRLDERGLYQTIVREGAFEFMCGAYLVEARVCENDEPCSVDYVAVTAYREPAKRFATMLCNTGKAYKIPLHEDGLESVKCIASNHAELRALGVNALDCEIEDTFLVMPRIELPTLLDFWAEQLKEGELQTEEVVKLFDRIRNDIYTAAKTGRCYWELVPANCFYDEKNGELSYFDQEYCTQGWDPDIALARAVSGLRYSPTFASIPTMQNLYQELLVRYKLQEERDMIVELAKAGTYREVFGDIHHQLQIITKNNAAIIGN
jgi:hypothetical protein